MKVLVTGGCGLIGYHTAKYYARKGYEVIVVDNLERSKLLGHKVSEERTHFNLRKLRNSGIEVLERDVVCKDTFTDLPRFDYIVHLAAQCGVPTSIDNPVRDFEINAQGTLNVLEVARRDEARVAYASTNKVYPIHGPWRYHKRLERWIWHLPDWHKYGFPLDGHLKAHKKYLINRTPYGCSKYTGDLFCQEYHHTYNVPTGIFRMSCIYGDHQFGFEEQGWATWFVIATLKGEPINIYGDGYQARDMLWVEDVVRAYDAFLTSDKLDHGVWNLGGGPDNVLSLRECLRILKELTGKESPAIYQDWRPSDQNIYTSDIRPVMKDLNWKPLVDPREGLDKIREWAEPILEIF